MNRFQGAAMGSPISPLIANIFVEEFEVKALSSIPHPPSLWLRFVDGTFVINGEEHSQDLLHHINNQDPCIQFTVEPTQQGSLPFLDTSCHHQTRQTPSATQSTENPPTQTNIYIGNSNHHIIAKQSVYNTLVHRAKLVPSTQNKLDRELPTHKDSITTLPVSSMGPQPVATQIHPPQPAQYHHHSQQQQQST